MYTKAMLVSTPTMPAKKNHGAEFDKSNMLLSAVITETVLSSVFKLCSMSAEHTKSAPVVRKAVTQKPRVMAFIGSSPVFAFTVYTPMMEATNPKARKMSGNK